MKRLIIPICLFLCLDTFCQQVELIVEEIHHTEVDSSSPLLGLTSYRLFLAIETENNEPNETYFVSSVQDSEQSLFFNTTTNFYQHEMGSEDGRKINPVLFQLEPELIWDSYVTIGSIGQTLAGVPSWEDQAGLIEYPGDPLPSPDPFVPTIEWVEEFENGNNLTQYNEEGVVWFGLASSQFTSSPFGVGTENYVYIGQFTTDGEFSFCFNTTILNSLTLDHIDLNFCSEQCYDAAACNFSPNSITGNIHCTFPGDECPNSQYLDGEYILDNNCECVEALTLGDINQDGTVTTADLTILVSQYGIESEDLPADLNGDGLVSVPDLTLMLSIIQN